MQVFLLVIREKILLSSMKMVLGMAAKLISSETLISCLRSSLGPCLQGGSIATVLKNNGFKGLNYFPYFLITLWKDL